MSTVAEFEEVINGVLVPVSRATDPATLGWPPFLPIELALGEDPPWDICKAYEITKDEFASIVANPAFQVAYKAAKELLLKEGMSFRVKARMQSEELLKTSWALIHGSHTPSNIKADMIKATWKVAGFEPKETDRTPSVPLQINIHL